MSRRRVAEMVAAGPERRQWRKKKREQTIVRSSSALWRSGPNGAEGMERCRTRYDVRAGAVGEGARGRGWGQWSDTGRQRVQAPKLGVGSSIEGCRGVHGSRRARRWAEDERGRVRGPGRVVAPW